MISLATCERSTLADVHSGLRVISVVQTLPADSLSYTPIEVSWDHVLNRDQLIRVSTSHGEILAQPYDFTIQGGKQVTLFPFDNTVEVLLVARTLDTVDQVYVTAEIDSVFKSEVINFVAALPIDMKFSNQNPVIMDDQPETILEVELFRSPNSKTSNGIRFYPQAQIEFHDSTQTDTLVWQLPDFAVSNNNKVEVPLRIVRHIAGTQLRVSLRTDRGDDGPLTAETLLFID